MLVNARKLFIIPLIFIGWNTVQAQEVWTLKQCIDTAQVYNKTLQINRNHISISEQREKEAKANLIPKVTANADYKYFMELPTQLMQMNALNPQAPEGQFRDIQLEKAKIVNGKSEITFKNLPKGKYAVNILHDENNNSKIDKGLILPKEGIGFSNYQTIGLRNRPNFSKASFELNADKTVEVKVIYM